MIPEELHQEVLTWLPVKALMRFKCISKTWLSIITDPLFTKTYRGGRSPSLISLQLYHQYNNGRCTSLTRVLYIRLDGGGTTSQILPHYAVYHGNEWKAHTNVVDGLVCFYHAHKSWLYNLATREMVKLPDSPILIGCKHAVTLERDSIYYFGFDPSHKVYKLLKISRYIVAILTIGVQFSWRILNIPHPVHNQRPQKVLALANHIPPRLDSISYRGPCLGGILCWENFESRFKAFHLAEEKFIRIGPLPWHAGVAPALMNFGQSMIVTTTAGSRNKILRYNNGIWVDESRLYHHADRAVLLGILPDGKQVICDPPWFFPRKIYIFDPSKRERKAIDHRDWVTLVSDYGGCFYVEENITSLKSLISRGTR